jgi:serine/threonine protein kinase
MKFIGGEATTDELTGKRHKAPGDTLWHAIKRFHADTARQDRLGLQQLLRRFVDVCNVVHFAHRRGVLHRDLKPGNVMLGESGETLVVDWGLARMIRRDAPDAQGEQQHWIDPPSAQDLGPEPRGPLGTYEFMSPEQAAGNVAELGVATDVYSLGATLYCILTGEYAVSRTEPGVLDRIKAGRFERPREKNTTCQEPWRLFASRRWRCAPRTVTPRRVN